MSGRAEVESVPTDRGFWIEEGGERLFVVLDPKQEETPYEVQEQSQVDIRQATVRASDYADELDIQLSPETREILAQQDVFLVADGPAVEVAQR